MIKLKRGFSKPIHPWEKVRILEENKLIESYGFKNKSEIWRVRSKLKEIREQAKRLVNIRTKQDEKEKKELIESLSKQGLVAKNAKIEDVLGLDITKLCDRRLQTIIHKKGLARTPKQARQLVSHGHVFVEGKKVTSPSKLVNVKEESSIKIINFELDEPTKKTKKQPVTKKEGEEQ